jgi:DNA-binding response OmpR family regulator
VAVKQKKRILVVEDDEGMRSLLRDFFEEEGFEVETAEDGAKVVPRLIKSSFDLVITDIRMPGLSGLDILPTLKKIQPGVAVLVITAFGGKDVRHRTLARGADAYLEKPLQLEKLKTLVNQLVSS